jgi:hypothetical protein
MKGSAGSKKGVYTPPNGTDSERKGVGVVHHLAKNNAGRGGKGKEFRGWNRRLSHPNLRGPTSPPRPSARCDVPSAGTEMPRPPKCTKWRILAVESSAVSMSPGRGKKIGLGDRGRSFRPKTFVFL